MTKLEAAALPILILILLLCAAWKKLAVFDLFLTGAKAGLQTCWAILPNLIAMLVSIALLGASGLLDVLQRWFAPLFEALGIPREIAPLALLRPLSGSGALAMVEKLMQTYGPDSRIGLIACTLMGSSETVLYTVCIYMGAIGKKSAGYTIPCALMGAFAAMVVAGLWFR